MMKNTLLTSLVIFLLGNLCHFGLPWWCLVPLAALVGWWYAQSGWASFLGGFLGGFLLWSVSAWFSDHSNGSLLSAKVGQLFMGLQSGQLISLSGLLGGFLAAFGALSGRMGKEIRVAPAKKRSYMQQRRR